MHTFFRSARLTTTHLEFTVRAATALELDVYSGAALRGSFFNAIWTRFCVNKEAQTCAQCPLHTSCPVSALVAPLREESSWGQDIPRPYTILPPLDGARVYEPGERFSFGMTLMGDIVQLLPYILLSISPLEAEGLGHRLPQNGGQRGHFSVEQVEVYHPWSGQRAILYQSGDTFPNRPVASVTIQDCLQRAEQLDAERITLEFITPMRIIDREHLVKQPLLRPLLQRLLERYLALERHYGNPTLTLSKEERDILLQQAEATTCSANATHWQELTSYSNRQKRATPISGLQGRATFTGPLAPLLPFLTIGELIHVGKNAVKGNGHYRILTEH
ncbi:MAG: CRISPR system precrRNA processing endoribonuclease RAMP protein Cas6 [Ktedonobacteraceae bacterium]|nr:CRISPR system precrRNA processing endoribonuclease RAMP protein Cas6 [Ktedonobacteraceae bacterium]